jgi:hypothetical protein
VLPDDAIVVRGGVMLTTDLATNLQVYNQMYPGQWGISVACEPNSAADDLAQRAPFRNRLMRVSTVGAIRGLGHDVVATGTPPHATLMLAQEPTEEDWEALRSVFSEPEANPRYT